MSEILIGSNPDNPQIVGTFSSEATSEEKGKQLPRPSGYHILVAIPEKDKEFEGSNLIKPDSVIQYERSLPLYFLL